MDNSEQADNDNSRLLESDSSVHYQWSGSNLGFATAYNILLKRAHSLGASYFLMLNPDMILEPEAINNLLTALISDKKLGSVAPKILHWDFINKQTSDIIDSCGIINLPSLRFVDLGQGEKDRGQYDQHSILGPSGCAGLYRLSALEAIKVNNQYFDQAFFMYKEDADLVYRLQLAGYNSQLVPTAIVYHHRTVKSQGRSWQHIIADRANKSKWSKQESFLGQIIFFYKYWFVQSLWQKFRILIRLKLILSYILFFEPSLLKQLGKFWRKKAQLKQYGK